jgi:hypothetical protein
MERYKKTSELPIVYIQITQQRTETERYAKIKVTNKCRLSQRKQISLLCSFGSLCPDIFPGVLLCSK